MPDYQARFDELLKRGESLPISYDPDFPAEKVVDFQSFQAWQASALNLLEHTFGPDSTYVRRMNAKMTKAVNTWNVMQGFLGLFVSAREEYSLGFLKGLRREISDEFVVDLCLHAESLLSEGHPQSAAVLAAAAMEDCFRRKVEDASLTIGSGLSENINALKGAGLLSGATAKLVAGYPKYRNAAMHADWNSIMDADTLGVCAFLKSYAVT